jgi:hypothetical protein
VSECREAAQHGYRRRFTARTDTCVKADLISEPGCALSGCWAFHGTPAHRIIIIAAAITPTISAAMITMCVGLLMICRSMANRVPRELRTDAGVPLPNVGMVRAVIPVQVVTCSMQPPETTL